MGMASGFVSVEEADSSNVSANTHFSDLLYRLKKTKKVVVVTGAGISVNSGIPVRVF